MDELHGDWVVLAFERDGRPLETVGGPVRFRFRDGEMARLTPPGAWPARYALGTAAGAIDLTYEYPDAIRPLVLPSLYRLRAGELSLAVPLVSPEMALAMNDASRVEPRTDRPGEFRTWPGARWLLVTLRRDEGTP